MIPMGHKSAEMTADEWVAFPGGELEGKRPRALCNSCRDALRRRALAGAPASRRDASARRPLCFQCYRADLERQRTLLAAGRLDTSSASRFQYQLPFEPVNRVRLETLRAARADVRAATPPHVDRRRRAQIEARRALQTIADGLRARSHPSIDRTVRERGIFSLVHAAELQLPDAWLPFVVSR